MELQGTVKKIFDIQTFASGFQKRELILMTQEQYPQPISIEFLSDKISLLDNISEGENIKIGINIRGREWTSPQNEVKYFNSITGWRLEKINNPNPNEPIETKPAETKHIETSDETGNGVFDEEDSDLPF
jgi:hypothetical protein